MTSIFEQGVSPTERPTERLARLPFDDPRLGMAKKIVEQVFATPRLRETLTSKSIAEISLNIQNTAADALGVSRDALRVYSAEEIEAATDFLAGKGGRSAIMRHGGQLSDTANKIRRMQLPRNLEDFLTTESIAESTGTATTMALILQRIGKRGSVHTSQNNRSAGVAILLGAAMKTVPSHNVNFDCVNYRTDLSDNELNAKIGKENNGAAPWNEGIDEICAEPGLYKRMNRLMARYAGDLMYKEGNVVHFYVTHTQQTQALDLFFGNKPTRLDELGFRLVSNEDLYNDSTTRLFKYGLYEEK